MDRGRRVENRKDGVIVRMGRVESQREVAAGRFVC